MKTKEELNTIKTEYEDVKEKLAELNDDELEQVTGGSPEDFLNQINEMLEFKNYALKWQLEH